MKEIRQTMYKMELIIESDRNKIDINNAIAYTLEEMESKHIIDKYSYMITASEKL